MHFQPIIKTNPFFLRIFRKHYENSTINPKPTSRETQSIDEIMFYCNAIVILLIVFLICRENQFFSRQPNRISSFFNEAVRYFRQKNII